MEPKALVLAAALSMSLAALVSAEAPVSHGFAVVELFTSEGCSSCPPADEAVGRLSAEAERNGQPIYALEWHVDYWDNLGWKDPFSSLSATERQYAYARALPSSVYTPQVVMNGTVVPSWAGNFREIERDARSLAAQPARAALSMDVLPAPTGGSALLRVRASAAAAPASAEILVALVEDGLAAHPTAGENAGQTLLHSAVVRSFAMLPAAGGEAELDVPPGLNASKAAVVGLLQDGRSMVILAAERRALPGPGGRISGRVTDPRGHGMAGIVVQACSGRVCVPGVSTVDGTFAFTDLAPGTWSLVAGPGGRTVQVTLALGGAAVLPDPIVLPRP